MILCILVEILFTQESVHFPIVVYLIVEVGCEVQVFLCRLGVRERIATAFVGISATRCFQFAVDGIIVKRTTSRELQPRQSLHVDVEHGAEHRFSLFVVVFEDAPPQALSRNGAIEVAVFVASKSAVFSFIKVAIALYVVFAWECAVSKVFANI